MKTDIPVYGGTLYFFTDFAKFNAHHKKAQKEELESAYGWTASYDDGGKHNLLIGVFDGSPQTLVHECIHAGMYVFERCNIDPTAESGEPYAYFVDYLYGLLVRHLNEPRTANA